MRLNAQEHSISQMDALISDTTIKSKSSLLYDLLDRQPFLTDLVEIQKGEALSRKIENKSGLFFLALLLLFLFASVRQMMTRHLNNLFGVFFKFQISKRQLNEQLENDRLSSWILTFVYFLCLGYILFRLISLQNSSFSSYNVFLQYFICVLVGGSLYLLKNMFVRLVAWIFQVKEAAENYLFNSSIVNEFTSIFLFPICIILIIKTGNFDSVFLTIAVGLLVLMFIYRFFRTFGVAKKFLRVNFVHFLLYLCTFEIMPLLILIRFISKA